MLTRPLTLALLLLIAAMVCFVVAILIAVSAVHGNEPAWRDGGLLALAASMFAR